jgi:hypothetical protein
MKCGTSLYGIGGSSLDDDFKNHQKETHNSEKSQLNGMNEENQNEYYNYIKNDEALCYNVNYLSIV